jgi:hypothetical protein
MYTGELANEGKKDTLDRVKDTSSLRVMSIPWRRKSLLSFQMLQSNKTNSMFPELQYVIFVCFWGKGSISTKIRKPSLSLLHPHEASKGRNYVLFSERSRHQNRVLPLSSGAFEALTVSTYMLY